MDGREEFVIDTTALSGDGRVQAIQFVLQLLDPEASTFELDVPLSNQDEWPRPVQDAAAVLCALRPPGRGENDGYRRTGMQQRSEEPVWDAFMLFAPYAFDAAVWDSSGRRLIHLADEGRSSVARLTDHEASSISEECSVPVVRLGEWRAAKH